MKDTDNPVNQSIRIKCSGREARENVTEKVAIGFGFTSDWMKKSREFFSQSRSVEIQNLLLFDIQVETALSQRSG